MNNDTKSKFAAILAAAQAKTATQTTPTFAPAKEEVKPVVSEDATDTTPFISEEITADSTGTVELSTITFDDLMNVREAVNCSPLMLIDYSDKAFAIVGETKPIKEQLKALGGRFNMFLHCGAGWIFSKTKLDSVKLALSL